MKTIIYCEKTRNGIHNFYISVKGQKHYLFSQRYKKGVNEYYHKPVVLEQAMQFSRAKRDRALLHTMEKMPMYIKYIEKEYGIEVLKQTINRNEMNRKKVA